MNKPLFWVVLAAVPLFACHDDDTVAGPGGNVVYPGVAGVYVAEWSVCGRRSVAPSPDYSNEELRVTVEQRDSRFSMRVRDVGTIVGELAPFEPGVLTYTWALRFDPPCSGVVSGSEVSTSGMRFTFPKTDDWECASCTDASDGMVRIFIPVQPL
jgi:hypothetical protein